MTRRTRIRKSALAACLTGPARHVRFSLLRKRADPLIHQAATGSVPSSPGAVPTRLQANDQDQADQKEAPINITIDGTVFQARLASGCAAQEFTRRMPTTLRMNELNGTEKYHFFDRPIPSEPQAVGEIRAGDLMLYGSDCLTLFFKTFRTSYAYTRLGWVEQPESLAQTLRPGTVSVNFSFTTV